MARHRLTIVVEIEGIDPAVNAPLHVAGPILDHFPDGGRVDIDGTMVQVWLVDADWATRLPT